MNNLELSICQLADTIRGRYRMEEEYARLLAEYETMKEQMVSPIRCRDCEYRRGDYCHHNIYQTEFFVYPDDYCSRGRRET